MSANSIGTDRPATQIEGLRAALVACGFLLDGERYADRIGLIGYGPHLYLVLDDPGAAIEVPYALHELYRGVRPVIATRDLAVAQQAIHELMLHLHSAGFWPPNQCPPCRDWRAVIVPSDALISGACDEEG